MIRHGVLGKEVAPMVYEEGSFDPYIRRPAAAAVRMKTASE